MRQRDDRAVGRSALSMLAFLVIAVGVAAPARSGVDGEVRIGQSVGRGEVVGLGRDR